MQAPVKWSVTLIHNPVNHVTNFLLSMKEQWVNLVIHEGELQQSWGAISKLPLPLRVPVVEVPVPLMGFSTHALLGSEPNMGSLPLQVAFHVPKARVLFQWLGLDD